jgi:hypothetical protein
MSYLANGHTDTLPVPGAEDGATVTFRASATWDDERALAKRAREIPETDDADRSYRFRSLRALLMIESWTLTDGRGEPLPLIEQTLSSGLSRRVATWIDEESTRRFEGHTREEEGPFDGRSRQPSTVTT